MRHKEMTTTTKCNFGFDDRGQLSFNTLYFFIKENTLKFAEKTFAKLWQCRGPNPHLKNVEC